MENRQDIERKKIEGKILVKSSEGLRVIAVGSMKVEHKDEVPASLLDCKLTLCGLIGLADPPREYIKRTLKIV